MWQFHIVLLDLEYIVSRYQILWSLLMEDVQGQQSRCSRCLRQVPPLLPLGCWRCGSLYHKRKVDFLGPCNGGCWQHVVRSDGSREGAGQEGGFLPVCHILVSIFLVSSEILLYQSPSFLELFLSLLLPLPKPLGEHIGLLRIHKGVY